MSEGENPLISDLTTQLKAAEAWKKEGIERLDALSEANDELQAWNKQIETELRPLKEKFEKAGEEIERLKRLLGRHKKSMEPFPIISDLRSISQRLHEKHSETEAAAIEAAYKACRAKFRKLYRDTEEALKENKDA